MNIDHVVLLAKGVDSLYLYCDCGEAIDWGKIMKEAEKYGYDEQFKFRGLPFVKIKAWMKTYPVCIQHNQFMFFINRKTAYIKVLSLAFELKGFEGTLIWLCRVLDQLTIFKDEKWLEYLKVSRIDVYVDFAYDGDFVLDQFKTNLRKKGLFKSGENEEAVTYYFGSRNLLLVRLYVKSEEIKNSGKDYLKSHWKEKDCQDSRIWRLEFEYHKDKILEICRFRELSFIDQNEINKLFCYGVNAIQYMVKLYSDRNIYKNPLHPIWIKLQENFNEEYQINRKLVYEADIEFRRKRARRWVMSWLIARGFEFDEIASHYIDDFKITRYDYEKAMRRQRLSSKSIKELPVSKGIRD